MKIQNAFAALRHRNHFVVSGTHLIRSALVLAIILGAVLGFWASSTSEHSEIPGVKSVVQVQSWVQDSDKADPHAEQLLGDLGEIATDHKADILVEIPTLQGRTVYAAGHNAKSWQQEGYRSLPGSPSVEVQPLSELPHGDYRQMFELTGGKDFLHAITTYLDNHGVQYLVPVSQQWTFLLEGTALGKLSALAIGVGFALAFIGIVLNSHADAVRRLHGIGLMGRAKAELFTAGRTIIPVALSTVVAVDVALLAYSNTASVQQLAIFQAMFIGVAFVACIVAIFFGLIVLNIASVIQLLKGKLPVKSVLFSMFTLRLGACIAVASFCIAALNYTTEWNRQDNEVAGWQHSAPAFGLTLSGARDLEDIHETSGQLADRLRNLSAHGRLLYAQYRDSGMSPESHIDKDSVVYNTTAAEQSLSGTVQHSFEMHRDDTQTIVLIPNDLPSTANIDKQIASITEQPTVKKVTYQSGSSSARTWEVGIDEWMNRAEVSDPIVVIMPDAHLNLSDRNLVAGVTQLDVLLRSYEDFHQLQNDDSVGSFVRSAVPMSQTWSQHHQAMGRILWVYIGGFVVSVLLCMLSSFAVWASFVKVFHQRIRVAYLHARWPVSPIMTALIAETIVGIWILHFLNQRAQVAQAWERGGSAEGAADPAMIALFHVPCTAWWVALTLFFVTSIVSSAFLLRGPALQQLVLKRR